MRKLVLRILFIVALLGLSLNLWLLQDFPSHDMSHESSNTRHLTALGRDIRHEQQLPIDEMVRPLPNDTVAPINRRQQNYPDESMFFNSTELLPVRSSVDAIAGAVYSAAWFQSTERFRYNQVKKISYLEDAVFKATKLQGAQNVRLTRDWLDFGVEHLSKWWRLIRVGKFDVGYWRLIINLLEYIRQTQQQQQGHGEEEDIIDNHNPFRDTIAVVAYHPEKADILRFQPLDIAVLGAQISSLVRCRTGRVVVFADLKQMNHTETHVWPFVVDLLRQDLSVSSLNATSWAQHVSQERIRPRMVKPEVKIGTTEIALVGVNAKYKSLSTAKGPDNLVPRAALVSLHDALFQREKYSDPEHRSLVLGAGGRERFKYVYYTEQDSPLHTRARAWPDFKVALDNGAVLTPHRLLAVPHAYDWIGVSQEDLPWTQNIPATVHNWTSAITLNNQTSRLLWTQYIPAVHNWTSIIILDKQATCCDMGVESRHGILDYPAEKGNFWYLKGFGKSLPTSLTPQESNEEMARRLERYSTYQLMRLKGGTGLTLAGCENARQCRPMQQPGQCHGDGRAMAE